MRLRIRLSLAFVIIITAFAVSLCAFAEDYSGYIVTLKDNAGQMFTASVFSDEESGVQPTPTQTAQLLSDSIDNVSEIYSPEKLVKTEDYLTLCMLVDSGFVESYEKDYKAELYGYVPENNPQFSSQWAFNAIKADYAWKSGIFGNNVRVGVIDSGIYPNVDIVNNLAEGYNYAQSSSDPTDTVDTLWHGTFVAGIIAAECNNLTTVGLAHRATVVPLRVCESTGMYVSDIIKGIYGAVDTFNCTVLNLSLGTEANSSELKKAVDYAIAKNCIVVAAAGNAGNTAYAYPASFSECISVANVVAVNSSTGISYSIYSTSQHNDMVDIAAPGTTIYSTANAQTGYKIGGGTSFAAPYVSALAALAKSIDPTLSQADFNYILKASADSSYIVSSGKNSTYWGSGMMDVESFVKMLLSDRKAYLSPVDVQTFGYNTSVYIHNPGTLSKEYMAVVTSDEERTGGMYMNCVKLVPVTLAPFGTYELSLTDLGLSGHVNVMLVDSISNLVPLSVKRSGMIN